LLAAGMQFGVGCQVSVLRVVARALSVSRRL
jgi:hypothetical protein